MIQMLHEILLCSYTGLNRIFSGVLRKELAAETSNNVQTRCANNKYYIILYYELLTQNPAIDIVAFSSPYNSKHNMQQI